MTSICGRSWVSMPTLSIGERARAERQRGPRTAAACVAARKPVARDETAAVPEYSAELARAVHAYLGKSPTALVTVQLEDMIGMLEPVNVPGTSREYSNWTRRVTASAREIFARPDVRELCAAMVDEPLKMQGTP